MTPDTFPNTTSCLSRRWRRRGREECLGRRTCLLHSEQDIFGSWSFSDLKTFHAGLLLKVSSLILHLWSLAPSSTNFDDRTRPLTRSSALRDCSSWCRCYKTSLYSVAGGARSKLECLFLVTVFVIF
jgi:hypothetical protein